MIELIVFIGFAVVAAVLALYSFLERNSWMLSQIAASLISTIVLWVETLLFVSGNIGIRGVNLASATEVIVSETESVITYAYTEVWTPIMEPSLGFLLIFFSAVMTIYTIMHVMTWLQERALGNTEEEDDE